jgi:hypothetical protein
LLTRTAATIAALLALLAFAGCGDEEESSSTTAVTEETASSAEEQAAVSVSSSTLTTEESPFDAIEATVTGWMLEGGCERMTDNFLEEQTFDDDPEQACETFEAQFTAPAYDAEDFEVDIEYENDTATATVSSPGIDVASVYKLVLEGDTWKIDSAELK